MAEREGIYISQLPESISLTDDMLFATDNGADNNSVSAANLAEYVNNKIDVAGQVNNGVSEANSYTDTKKTEAVNEVKEWSKEAFSNPSLLINGDFQVWQRGESRNVSVKRYIMDRFALTSSNGQAKIICEKSEKGAKLYITNGIAAGVLFQYAMEEEDLKKVRGKQVILTSSINDVIRSYAFIVAAAATENTNILSNFLFPNLAADGTPTYVNWIKLELGEISTPFVPRPYAEELALCQRYYQVLNKYGDPYYELGMTAGKGGTTIYSSRLLPTEMRIAPTITAIGTWRVDTGNTRVANINTISATADANNPTTVGFTITTDNTITKDVYVTIKASGNANSRVTLDAEIY